MRYLVLAAWLCCTFQGFSQFFSPAEVPRGYFRDPLAVPMSLAANFGELRPNHYHMGLDIRTQHRERSEEHTSELQSPDHLVCRLLLEKKKPTYKFAYWRVLV